MNDDIFIHSHGLMLSMVLCYQMIENTSFTVPPPPPFYNDASLRMTTECLSLTFEFDIIYRPSTFEFKHVIPELWPKGGEIETRQQQRCTPS